MSMPMFIEVTYFTNKEAKCLINLNKVDLITSDSRGGCRIIFDQTDHDSYILAAETYKEMKNKIEALNEMVFEMEEV